MASFELIAEDVYLLKVPFGIVWTGIVLINGEEKILIDSANCDERIDDTLIPALSELGLKIEDISYLLLTHTHGDHVGGARRIKELSPKTKLLVSEEQYPKTVDPLKYSKLIRATFPEHSPQAPASLKGTEPDGTVAHEETVAKRLKLIPSAGHDTDSVCFLDIKTKTVISGDSLQANGTPAQGIGLYTDLEAYKATLSRLLSEDIENIIAGHDYLPVGAVAKGKSASRAYLTKCAELIGVYDSIIVRLRKEGKEPAEIAREMIKELGLMEPSFLFLPLYTVTAHIKMINN